MHDQISIDSFARGRPGWTARLRRIAAVLATLLLCLGWSAAEAQGLRSMPPGGALVFGPFGGAESAATIESFEAPRIGTAYRSDGNARLVYEAPPGIEETTTVTIAYTLAGEDAPRSLELRIDPAFSSAQDSAAATALEWLFILLIIALFIEAAVLSLVAALRVFVRLIKGKDGLGTNGMTPTVYKPIFALVLSGIAVTAFGIAPLSDVITAFGTDSAFDWGPTFRNFADVTISTLLVAGGSESVRRVAVGILGGLVPNAATMDQLAEKSDSAAR